MTAADDLRATAHYIEKVGHARNTFEEGGREGSRVCALGGMARVCGLDPNQASTRNRPTPRLAAAVLALRGYLFANNLAGNIPVWNDSQAKDQYEVVVTLEKAAAWIEEQA